MIILKLIFILLTVIVINGQQITIPNGASARWVSDHLKEKKIINNSYPFFLYLKINKLTSQIHSGEFHIPKNASFNKIATIITGKVPQYIKLTIPEGFTINEIAKKLESEEIIKDANSFKDYINSFLKNNPTKYNFIKTFPSKNLEGILFPDTYYFSKFSTNKIVVDAFLKQFNAIIVNEYNKVKKPKLSLYKTLILASIIEKEAASRKEMPIISGVFYNRLKKKMYLGSCPTVGYAMGQPRKKRLSYDDLKFKSKYNTYIHKGLPPTPIASPGKAAFLAALNPAKTNYYYFVAKNNGTGTHIFSKTLKEHLDNQQKILSDTN